MRAKVISPPYIHTVPEVLILEVLVPPLPVEEHLEADLTLVLLGRQALGRVVPLAAFAAVCRNWRPFAAVCRRLSQFADFAAFAAACSS